MDYKANALKKLGLARMTLKRVSLNLSSSKDADTDKEIHSDIIELIFLLTDAEKDIERISPSGGSISNMIGENTTTSVSQESDPIAAEIVKVKRKVPQWFSRPKQINSKILKIFLELYEAGNTKITEELLAEVYGKHSEFYRNFNQMKIISEKNHGKVFEVMNGTVTLWEPVKDVILGLYKDTQ